MARKVGRIPVRLPNGQNAPAELVGERFGKLLIIAQEPGRSEQGGYTIWRARCDCGREIIKPTHTFLNKYYGIKQCRSCAPIGRPRIPNNGAHLNSIYANLKRGAEKGRARAIEFDLTKKQVLALIKGDCIYCGAPPVPRYSHPNLSGDYAWNGIDRIDSAGGYVWGNVVSCCGTCNIAKAEMTLAEFREWIERAYRHLNPKQGRRKPDRAATLFDHWLEDDHSTEGSGGFAS